jgi:acetyl-CoA C-acetyltransferase
MPEAYIVAAARTAGARKGGRLSGWHPADLAAQVLNALLDRAQAEPDAIDDVIMGCVTQTAEQAFNVARNAVLSSRLPESVPATTVDRQCGSSQQALHFAAQAVMSGSMDVVIAAGVESMTRVPMGLSVTLPTKLGYGSYVGAGMAARYPNVEFSQFAGAELMAKKYNLPREALDVYALESHRRAARAAQSDLFKQEIAPVAVRGGDGGRSDQEHSRDEGIRYDASLEAISGVKLLAPDGCITAATSSQVCDGAAGLLVVNDQGLRRVGVEPLARIHQMTVVGHDPVIMLEAPLPATQQALRRAGMKIGEIDLYEVNEAFAPVPLAWLQATGGDPDRLNVHGGAIALGHPLGVLGAELMITLLYALEQRGARYGLQTMCEGGGLANVTIVERL